MKEIVLYLVFFLLIGMIETLYPQIPNVRITNNSWHQNEPMLAINPTYTNKMVCGYNDPRSGYYKLGWSWSDNGGLTWTFGGNFSITGYNRGGDPIVAFDNMGTAYIAGLVYNYDVTSGSYGKDGSIFLAKSNDGGHTFSTFQKVVSTGSGRSPHLDKPWLYINPANNHIYLAWVKRDNAWGVDGSESMTIWFTKSTDGGQNFSTPIQISTFSPATGTNRSHGPQITAVSANQVYVSWHTLEAGTLPNPPTEHWKIWISESTDGGQNFGTNHKVLDAEWGYPNRFVTMDADPSTGRIYIGYTDSHVQSPRDYDIFVTSATSVSGPWSSPVKLNDDPAGTGRWQFWPSIDISPNGRVDVMWYDYRDNTNGIGVYYTSSSDGGTTWSANVKVTDLPNGFTPTNDFAGDYNGITSLNEKTQIAWMDTRNTNQEIYTATVIKPIDSMCFPPHRGVPGSTGPPIIDGKVQEDVGWRGAYRITYGNGTNIPHVACQALKHNSDNYIYLSFEVRNDPTFDNDDVIVINFRPDRNNGTFANDRKVVIYPVCDNDGAAGPSCSLTTPDDKTDREPRQIKFYRNSQNWVEIPAAQIQNYEVKVRSYADGSDKAWNVELKIPTTTTIGGSQWGNFSDEFLFYFNVVRVTGTNASEFRWPENSPETNGEIDLYPFYPWEWGEANKSNTATCKGVYFSNYMDIGTENPSSSEINYDPPPGNTYTNTFYANVFNNTEVGGVSQIAKDVQVRFRLANWGIPSKDDWSDILVSNPVCPNVLSNPTCVKDIPAATSGGPGTETFNLEWLVPDAEIPLYQAHKHQCLLAELDSRSNTKITTKSIYRNMDFEQASKFTRSAEISAKGYPEPSRNNTNQKFSLQVYTKEYTYGGTMPFDTLRLTTLLNKKQFDEKKPVSVLNYNVHGYHYNGRKIIINEHDYDIIDPVGSFGYIISHQGLVKEWKHTLVGCEMIQPLQYEVDIASDQKATVFTEIEPIDDFMKWSLSLHSGYAIPTGNFANDFDPGFNILVDADYHFSRQISMVALFGYNNFKSKIPGVDDNNIINLTVNLRYHWQISYPWTVYLGGGPGLFIPENGNNDLGANIGIGLNYDYSSLIDFEFGIDYHSIFDQNIKFIHSHVGIILRF